MLGPADVGHRVVVRHRVSGSLRTDVLGELVALEPDQLLVRTEDGVEHEISLRDVEAAKRVPPRPRRYSEVEALERVADAAWPAPVWERLGGWVLRAAGGWTNRANSALPLGDPGLPLDAAVTACAHWYAGHRLPPRVTVPLPVRRDVAAVLTAQGWLAQPPVLVQTAPVSSLHTASEGAAAVTLVAQPSPEFLALVSERKQGLPPAAMRVLTGPDQVRFAEVRGDDGGLLGVARGAVVEDWLHLSLVEVVPSARRRGLARGLGTALARWAADTGATRALLQVEEHNAAAIGLYASLGFTTHHRYVTFRLSTAKREE
jgi:GNAT superfamily N-acetyltransferase